MTGPARHQCPGVAGATDQEPARELAAHLLAEPLLGTALGAVAASGLPDAWIGAGVIRDVVWGRRHGGFDPAGVRDIDVVFYDPGDLSRERDQAAQRALEDLAGLPWEASNEAAVHTWFHHYFGGPPVPPLRSVHDAVAAFPEFATCVAVRLSQGSADELEVCAPHGLGDLLGMTWRRNPARVSLAESRARLARQRVAERWPRVAIVPPA
jgi:hypothetical protein